ncbi:MAG: thioesterase family protein [Bacteroidia bacterium]
MKTVTTPVQIRFADVDKLGHVNNAIYLSYIEIARMDFFKELGGKIDWSKKGVIVGRIEINYKIPVLITDVIAVKTWCTRIGNKSFDLSYSIVKTNGGIEAEVVNAISVLVCYDYELKKSVEMPEEWRQWLIS